MRNAKRVPFAFRISHFRVSGQAVDSRTESRNACTTNSRRFDMKLAAPLFFLAASLALAPSADAQSWKDKLKAKAREKLEQAGDKAVDKAVGDGQPAPAST